VPDPVRLWNPGDQYLSARPPHADGFAKVDRELTCDIVVVGTGPGGAACARALALGGASVVLLEEGPAESRFALHYGGTMRHHYQEGGAMVATGTTYVPIAAGRGIGGGSLVNSAIAWRAPDHVLDGWTKLLDDDRYGPAALAPLYDELWALLGIWPTRPEVSGANNDLIVRGVRALGLDGGYLQRATPGCTACGVCYFGCPSGGKASVNQNLLVEAVANGARIQAETKVDTFLLDGDRVVGVVGTMSDPDTGETGGRVTVRAGRVVLAAGGIGTPRTLHVAGLAERLGPAVGRGLHIHPGNAVLGFCDTPIELWRGATQGAYFHVAELPGVLPHTFSAPPEACLGILNVVGSNSKAMLPRLRNLCGLVVMISDVGEGTVSAWSDGRARISYDFVPDDVDRIKKGMHWAAKVLLAGGAREVFAPVRDTGMHTDADSLYAAIAPRPLDDFTMYASHPMSTCRMGRDPTTSVIRADGRTHALDGLYLADSSVFPTSLGVNPSITTMAMGTVIGKGLLA
jgi:choline dehydrogenase-like flavoprotein